MRARASRRAVWLVALATLAASAMSLTGAGAQHPGADHQWIAQAGDGAGLSRPLIPGFNVRSVHFDHGRFKFPGGSDGQNERPGDLRRYAAFGTIDGRLAFTKSENGQDWTAPDLAFVQRDEGTEPFIIGNAFAFVEYVNYTDVAWRIAYWDADLNDPFAFEGFRMADSADGVNWTLDGHEYGGGFFSTWQTETGKPPLLSATAGAFNNGSFGPTQLFRIPGGITTAGCESVDPDGSGPRVASPWNCQFVLIYDVFNGTTRGLGIGTSYNGVHWRGYAAPILTVGAAGEWDDAAATNGRIIIRPNPANPFRPFYDLYYTGSRAGSGCAAGTAACSSIGTARSLDGLTYTKATANPVSPRSLFDTVFPSKAPNALLSPVPVDDRTINGGGHDRIYFTRATQSGGSAVFDTFQGFAEPAPTQAPRVRIDTPKDFFQNTTQTPIQFFVTDTLSVDPAKLGINLSSLEVRVDGNLIGGFTREYPSLVTGLTQPAYRFTRNAGLTNLADGDHTFEVTVKDLEDNVGSASATFTVDTVAPSTTIATSPSSPRATFPIGGLGRFTGQTIENATGVGMNKLVGRVVNPLGQVKLYEISGQLVTKASDKVWNWAWNVPSPDMHTSLPGNYTISILGQDKALNLEAPSPANTRTVLALI